MKRDRSLFSVVGLLLLLAASRILQLDGLEMHIDEVWSVWQTFGTPQQILSWTPYDWTPLHYLFLGGWKNLVGIHPVALRMSSVLAFIISAALFFRVVRRLRDERTAFLVVIVYGALGYSLRISSEVRGYMLMITLLIFSFWWTLRYFHAPSLRRALPLGVGLAAIFYTYMPGVIGFVMLGLYTLIVYPRSLLKWWLPGAVAAALAAPMIIVKIPQLVERVTSPRAEPGFLAAISDYFRQFTVFRYVDYPILIWIILLVAATLLILWRYRSADRSTTVWFAWAFGLPLILFLLNPILKFFDQHYAMALMIGIALWIGWGLGYLERVPRLAATGVLLAITLYPLRLEYYPGYWRPLISTFEWLRTNAQAGDVFLIDPNCCNAALYEWDYAAKLFFPEGMIFVDQPADHRRIWYVTDEQQRDPGIASAVAENRVQRQFVGVPYFFFRLYEAPPDLEGILFENGMRFHGVDVLDNSGARYESGPLTVRREGETIRLRLWWSVDQPPQFDYSVGVYVMIGRDQVAAQSDGPPLLVNLGEGQDTLPRETSRWLPGSYYVEERVITLPYMPKARTYTFQVNMAVYQWWDSVRVPADVADADRLLRLWSFDITAW